MFSSEDTQALHLQLATVARTPLALALLDIGIAPFDLRSGFLTELACSSDAGCQRLICQAIVGKEWWGICHGWSPLDGCGLLLIKTIPRPCDTGRHGRRRPVEGEEE